LAAELTFTPKSSQEIASEVDCYLKKRRFQTRGRSCGCVFKNSGEISAGKLIDEAGLKGLSIGGATVSRDHANFIINSGTRSSDVYKLIKEVKRIVLEKTGILLVEEVVYIGDFNDTFS
ncbi:MAG: hypothetical protein K2J83_06775, partial [Clostridia bacterium]|nr:hypothetical protein [Clostridia bacterium]